jgi:hypothetical protein
MPSTARGNPGEVLGPPLPSKSSPTHITLIPPFRPRPCLFVGSKSPSKTRARLQFITLPRRRPPYTLHAACARFRLAKKKSTPPQLDDATLVPALAVVELLQARARDLNAQLQQIHSLLDNIQKIHRHIIHTHPLASSSSLHLSTQNLIQHLGRISRCGLAIRAVVAPLETSLRALPSAHDPFLDNAIT